jgi:hypothetical protein
LILSTRVWLSALRLTSVTAPTCRELSMLQALCVGFEIRKVLANGNAGSQPQQARVQYHRRGPGS